MPIIDQTVKIVDIKRFVAQKMLLTFALITILFGLSSIIGWVYKYEFLIRYIDNSIAIVINAALNFIILGYSIILAYYNRLILARSFTCLSLTLSIIVLSQFVFDYTSGIDNLFFDHYDSKHNPYAGRMAINTTLCFIIASIANLLIMNRKFLKQGIIAGTALGFMLLCMSIIFIGGYISTIQEAYFWGTITPMALNTAIGFMLLSISIMCMGYYYGLIYKVEMSKYIPYILGICIMLSAIMLSHQTHKNQLKNDVVSIIPLLILIGGTIVSLLVIFTTRLAQIAALNDRRSKELLAVMRATLDSTTDGIIVVDNLGKIIDYNNLTLTLWNLSKSEINKMDRRAFIHYITRQINDQESFTLKIKELYKLRAPKFAYTAKLKNGLILEIFSIAQKIDNIEIGRVWSFRDNTEQHKLENQLLHNATHDTLTDFPNKASILNTISQRIEQYQNTKNFFAIIMIDLDRFTRLNDIFGHSKCDILLKEISSAIHSCLTPGYTFGRIGGDEFVILTNEIHSLESVSPIINRIKTRLEQPFKIFDNEVFLTCCMGVVFYPKDGHNVDTLLSNADLSLLRAKHDGHNNFQFYSQDLNKYTLQHIQIEHKLREALAKSQLQAYYQPIIDLKTNKIISCEALVRWIHPTDGMIPPSEFISVAEETGLINEIGYFVFNYACNDLRKLIAQGYTDISMSVNISAVQLKHNILRTQIDDILKGDIRADQIELELTEGILFDASNQIIAILNEYRSLGFNIAIDDFGTGYSSLTYLKRFPISKIKIDRSFISDIEHNKENLALVKAIIAMSRGMGLTVLAEGVENKEQLEILKGMGCDQIQGFYFAKPMPYDLFVQYIADFSHKTF